MKSKLKSIRLNNELIAKIEIMAKNENRSFNNMVETILLREIKKQKIKINI